MDPYWSEWGTLFDTDMNQSFRDGDEMPRNRLKLAHQQGVVARVVWTPIGNAGGYTGTFASGSTEALLRLSETDMLNEESSGLKPSLALKLLRDGQVSDNIMGMPSFEGSNSWNFFQSPFRSRVAAFGTNTCPDLTIRKKLATSSRWPFSCGYSRVAQHLQDGSEITGDLSMPYEISFRVNEPYASMFSHTKEFDSDGNQVSWLEQMGRLERGAELFTVEALTAPVGVAGSERVDIGTIALETRLRTSKFGDERLFFAHMRQELDRQYFPRDWRQADAQNDPAFDRDDPAETWTSPVPAMDSQGGWPSDDAAAKTMWMEQIETHGCPFYWLLESLTG